MALQLTSSSPLTKFVNLILSCGHVVYKREYDERNHKVGEEAWCPTCGLVGITEIEGPYAVLEGEQ